MKLLLPLAVLAVALVITVSAGTTEIKATTVAAPPKSVDVPSSEVGVESVANKSNSGNERQGKFVVIQKKVVVKKKAIFIGK
ncbi:unnamed protein product [Allacma fusca]|uniref:Uncharacterized protein n=1 Tax=Allacma fusca TaxID=39272 RepID=A0A8J2PKU7_9HEXA|nr:unnamed protein product [Allacma fusca]